MTILDLSLRSGIHQSTISRLENDPRRLPRIETFFQLAKGFGLSIQEFAILTEVDISESDQDLSNQNELFVHNYNLINKSNLLLLQALEEMDGELKEYLINFVLGLKEFQLSANNED